MPSSLLEDGWHTCPTSTEIALEVGLAFCGGLLIAALIGAVTCALRHR